MGDSQLGDSVERKTGRLGWPLTIASGFALLFVALAMWTAGNNYVAPTGGDFISFWSAGRLALQGHSAAAYDIAAHRSIEQMTVPRVGLIPFPYPPPFLIVVAPFALLPFGIAFILWVLLTAALYGLAIRRIAPLAFGMANPPLLVDYLSGQSGLLISAIFVGGASLIASAPFTAGMLLGLLILKPQIALLLPVAMIAGGEWRVIAGAVASSIILLLAGIVIFGPDSYQAFFHIIPQYVHFMRQNRWDWREFASIYGVARYFGLRESAALLVQVLAAASAAAVTAVAWFHRWDEKIAVLAAGSLLMSGYMLTYDALLLIVPAAQFLRGQRWELVATIWVLTALPVVHFFKLYGGPNTIPCAAVLSIGLLVASHLKRRGKTSVTRAITRIARF